MSSVLSAFEFVARQCQDLHVRANINVSTAGFIRKLKLRTTCAFMCHASVNAIGDSQEYPPPPSAKKKNNRNKTKTKQKKKKKKSTKKKLKEKKKEERVRGPPPPLPKNTHTKTERKKVTKKKKLRVSSGMAGKLNHSSTRHVLFHANRILLFP